MRQLTVETERFPLARAFTIARGSKTEAEVVTCTIAEGGHRGRGECVPYRRYGETVEGVVAAISAMAAAIEAGMDRAGLAEAMPAGAARNAIDCALWDLEARRSGKPAHLAAGVPVMRPLTTAVTLSLGAPEEMAADARAQAHRPLLKVKVGAEGDAERIRAVAGAAPGARIILDANEGWTAANIEENLAAAARHGVALVEQPLPAGADQMLREIRHPVPICADESAHTAAGMEALVGLYEAVNIKLDKSGGLTEALAMRERARALGFGVMVGCMVGTSLGMAPALIVAQGADFVDLDGPLLLARDREPGLSYEGSTVLPPASGLWG
jgi:L-alanine-DL-glutamate epimerase-like enolase superfamily enzyme